MKHTIAGIVDRYVFDLSPATIVDAADTGQNIVADELIEELALEGEMLGRLYIDQRVIDDEIPVRAADQR